MIFFRRVFFVLVTFALGVFLFEGSQAVGADSSIVRMILPNGLRVVLAPMALGPSVLVSTRFDAGFLPLNNDGALGRFAPGRLDHHGDLSPAQISILRQNRGLSSTFELDGAALTFVDRAPSHELPFALWTAAGRFSQRSPQDSSKGSVPETLGYRAEKKGLQLLLGPMLGGRRAAFRTLDFSALIVPNNAVLTVVGDFESKRLEKRIRAFFAPLTRGQPPSPLPLLPEQDGAWRTTQLASTSSEGSGLWFGVLLPRSTARETAANQLLETVLLDPWRGEIRQQIVRLRGLASDIEGGLIHYDGWSVLSGFLRCDGPMLPVLSSALEQVLEGLSAHQLTNLELESVKLTGTLSRSHYRRFERLLGLGALLENAPHHFLTVGNNLQGQDAQTLFEVAARRLNAASGVTVHVEPGASDAL